MLAHKSAEDTGMAFFQYATNFFQFCGLWRVDGHPWWLEPYVYFSRFNVFFTFGWFFTVSTLTGCYLYAIEGDTNHLLSWLTFALAYCTMQYKFLVLCRNERKILDSMNWLKIWSTRYPDKEKNVSYMLSICNKLMIFGGMLMGIACIGFCCLPFLLQEPRVLPIKTIFTFGLDLFKSPTFEIYVFYVTAGALTHNIIAIAFDMLYIGILLTTSAIIRNLNTQMRKDLVESTLNSEDKYKALREHIKQHNEIRSYLNGIRSLYMTSNLLHFLYNYTNAGLTLLQISKLPFLSVEFFAISFGFSSVIFGLMTYCEAGQKVSDEIEDFWKILYLSDWYNESIKFQKTINIALLGTRAEYYMLAGKVMSLSRETEQGIMNAIYTYYAFLHRFN